MPDDVIVAERIFFEGSLVATPGDRINAEDARRWAVGPDGKAQPAVTAAGPSSEALAPAPLPRQPRTARRTQRR